MKGSLCRPAETSFLWRDTVTKTRERFNPRAPCGARPAEVGEPLGDFAISTHAPLAGRDRLFRQPPAAHRISTHAPLAGRDVLRLLALRAEVISTHAPLAGRDLVVEHFKPLADISTHAPLAGRDVLHHLCHLVFDISTHAPLAGRDITNLCRTLLRMDFNPRAPCGARQQKCTNHYAHFCDNRQISDVFAQNADCQGILFLFCARKTCKF